MGIDGNEIADEPSVILHHSPTPQHTHTHTLIKEVLIVLILNIPVGV
jgi:hypothetical protein